MDIIIKSLMRPTDIFYLFAVYSLLQQPNTVFTVKCSYLWRKRLVVIQLVRIFHRMAINLLYDMT